ncbi:MAG TPA: hypothetical protein PKJ37_12565 [Acidobacteriota bacterium]|nr:hypothetical protein [Acidobacteriota bacterium]
MTKKQFEKVMRHSMHRRELVFGRKQAEYAPTGDNVFHNFERAAAMQGISREEALRGMMVKHLVSIFDMIDGAAEGKSYPREVIDQKLGDMDIYNLLLEGMFVEGAQ